MFNLRDFKQEKENVSGNPKLISRKPEFCENGDSSSVVDEGDSPTGSITSLTPAPCRQFWKAGNYDVFLSSKATLGNGKNYVHIHPKFLHSNATSHKWVFGAIAELIDNAFDEVENRATYVCIDKVKNPRNGSDALRINDDGGGMTPESMRHCMSFGFSDKKSKTAIGQYGNGFKTSSMRLGSDVIVFSRNLNNSRSLTQSIGLLSYTFLTQTGHDRIVVPMVHYELDKLSMSLLPSCRVDRAHFNYNLSLLIKWSPYSCETELLHQFNDIGCHGTKIILYNLWLDNDRSAELNFDSDPQDILITRDARNIVPLSVCKTRIEQHIANKFQYSLRAYLSILYRTVPDNFKIILRGEVVNYHNIADDLKFLEYILYRPHNLEGDIVTTIGFVKEAPRANIHGFSVYHKNRLILPFWKVLRYTNHRGRGVVGVLQANFIQPTHNKQDFEKTPIFQKLEDRLRKMTTEYWDHHCALIGHRMKTLLPVGALKHQASTSTDTMMENSDMKRMLHDSTKETQMTKRRAVVGASINNFECMLGEENISDASANQLDDDGTRMVSQENNELRIRCSELGKQRDELNCEVGRLKEELKDVQEEVARLVMELRETPKAERDVIL